MNICLNVDRQQVDRLVRIVSRALRPASHLMDGDTCYHAPVTRLNQLETTFLLFHESHLNNSISR